MTETYEVRFYDRSYKLLKLHNWKHWLETADTPAIGDTVVYWRCGDDNRNTFDMPHIGETVVLRSISHSPPAWSFGNAVFVRTELLHYTRETAVGDCHDSRAEYRRVPALTTTSPEETGG